MTYLFIMPVATLQKSWWSRIVKTEEENINVYRMYVITVNADSVRLN